MKRKLPPFASVRAFEAAARLMSFKDAAEELCVTPSAVSHQIGALEDYLGTQLFLREANKLFLTRTGRTYLTRLSQLLDGLDESTREATGETRPMRVLCTPGFAARWLVPRMDRAPGSETLRLRVSDGAPSVDFSTNDADVVIHWGMDPVDGAEVFPLLQSGRHAVASPGFIAEHGIETPDDLARVRLLHDEVMDGWADWFRIAGVPVPHLPAGPRFPHCEMATTAAEQGLGVMLAYDAVAGLAVDGGKLIRLFDGMVTMPITMYSVAYQTARASDPRVLAFRDWLMAEAQADGTAVVSDRSAMLSA